MNEDRSAVDFSAFQSMDEAREQKGELLTDKPVLSTGRSPSRRGGTPATGGTWRQNGAVLEYVEVREAEGAGVKDTPEIVSAFNAIKGKNYFKDATLEDLFTLAKRQSFYEPGPTQDDVRCAAIGCKIDSLIKTNRGYSKLMMSILFFAINKAVTSGDKHCATSQVKAEIKGKTYTFCTGQQELIVIQVAPKKNMQVPGSFVMRADIKGSTPVIFELKPDYDSVTLTVWGGNQKACERFIEWFDELVKDNNFLRGAKIDGKGGFLDVEEKSWDDLVLAPGVRDRVERDILQLFSKEKIYLANGLPFKRGFALLGPPGTGKTSLIKVLANELKGVTLILVTPDCLNYGASSVSHIFDLAIMLSPTIVAFEDADIFLAARGVGSSNDPILAEIMNRLDGVKPLRGVVTGITTNRPEVLEQALIDRPGRIDVRIYLGPPSPEGRVELLRRSLRKASVDAKAVARIAGDPRIGKFTACKVVDVGQRAIMRAIDAGRYKKEEPFTADVTHEDLSLTVDDMLRESKMGSGDFTGNGVASICMAAENTGDRKPLGHGLLKTLAEIVGDANNMVLRESASFEDVLNLYKVVANTEDPDLDKMPGHSNSLRDDVSEFLSQRRMLRRHGVKRGAINLAKDTLENNEDATLRDIITALTGDDQ